MIYKRKHLRSIKAIQKALPALHIRREDENDNRRLTSLVEWIEWWEKFASDRLPSAAAEATVIGKIPLLRVHQNVSVAWHRTSPQEIAYAIAVAALRWGFIEKVTIYDIGKQPYDSRKTADRESG